MRALNRGLSFMRIATLALLAIAVSTAASADEIADARRAFISGMKHFDLGEYDQALSDFKNGYRAKEDPVFLYNIAQCYRMMKENRDAIRYYRLYLSRAPDAPNRIDIEERIAKLQAAVDAEKQTPVAPAANATAPPAAPKASAITTTASPPSAPRPTPVYKKWWLWTIVGAVAVGAGVGLGIGLTRDSSPSGTTFPTAGF